MPFTLAHPAAALLFRGTPLPVAAVVAGTMAPDVPVYLNAYGDPYDLTHSITGVLTVDLLVATAAVALWLIVLRNPVVDLMPAPVRERLDPDVRFSRTQWLLAAPAAVAGSLTHVGWDHLTHLDRWSDRGFLVAQYTSTVVGLGVCALWAYLAVRALPRRERPRLVPGLGPRALLVAASVALAAGLAAGATAPEPGPSMFLSQTAVVGTIVGAVCLVLLAALWHASRRRP